MRGRLTDALAGSAVAVIIPLMLVAPALWNGYALLQYDTGGYLARWHEGTLVVSRSTVFGLYLNFGEITHFWLTLGCQALAALWLIHATLRVFGLARSAQVATIAAALSALTALPILTSLLLTDIFAGLSVLSLFLLVVHGARFGTLEKTLLILFTAFASATHSATLGVLAGLCCAGLAAWPWLRSRLPLAGLMQGSLSLVLGALMLLAANVVVSGKLAWTPGGSSLLFGRMLQDGFVTRYLNDHCAQEQFKLCPYRHALPATADDFLWGNSVFDKLGRFAGLDDEMASIAGRALLAYPRDQALAALRATAQQLVSVSTGEGSHDWMAHSWGIFARYLPQELPAIRAARQQQDGLDFTRINMIHVPVALGSMLGLVVLLGRAVWRRRCDDLTMFASVVTLALLGNAVLCGALSGPHDRYGARMVWLATFVVLIALAQWVTPAKTSTPSRTS